VLYQIPLGQVAAWPAWQLDLLETYLAREPAPVERLEVAIARLTAQFVHANQAPNQPTPKVIDFLPYRQAWPEPTDGRYNETDREVLKELM
jgi:hypothetical protein